MFPTLTHLFDYLFGIHIPLPIQTFGFVVALAFLSAYWAFEQELKRKEKEGKLHSFKKTVTIGEKASFMELFLNVLLGFLVGYKFADAALNYSALVDNPQEFLLSSRGNFIGGLIGAIAFGWWTYAEKNKQALPVPKKQEVIVHPYELMGTMIIWAAVFGFAGAKLFNALENWDAFINDPVGMLIGFSGLTYYGGLVCGGLAVLYIARKHGIGILDMLDVGAPGLMLSYGIGRIGCQLAGDGDWGIANPAPKPLWLNWAPNWVWAFNYPHNVNSEGIPIAGCMGKYCNQLPAPVFPTPFYESVVCIALSLLLWRMRKKWKLPGIMFGVYLILNGMERFLVELIRVNTRYHAFGISFTQAEMISLILFFSGIVLIAAVSRSKELQSVRS